MPSRFSYQLYTSRHHPPLDKTIAMLAKVGFKEVEGFPDAYGAPAALRQVMDANGITMPSGHFGLAMLEKQRKKVLATATALGIGKLVVPYLPPDQRPRTARDWKALGKRLNTLASVYRQEGYSLAWHNHDFEFQPFRDGTTPHEHLFANAPLLDWEIDIAWIVRGRHNPLTWIRRYAGIITMAHVKDIAAKGADPAEEGWADLGDGVMNWSAYFAALKTTRCMHWVIEHDRPSDDARFARRSLAAARKL